MNIMFLIFSFNIGGIERQLIEMCNAMVHRHRIWLCVINRDYTDSLLAELSDNVTVILLNKEPGHGGMLPYMKQLAEVIRREHIQILHCQGINCVIFSALVRVFSPRTRILNTVHDIGNYSSYSSGKIFVQNRICDMTIAISHSVEKEIRSRAVPQEKIITIYNAINIEKFQYRPHKSGRNTSSAANGLPAQDRTIRICNVARFYPAKKGQDLLVEALLKLRDHCPDLNFHCTFAGAPAAGQEETLHRLQQQIHAAGMDASFSFLGNVDDVPVLLAQQDFFVLPSRYEGFGISLVEAMATGLPCVAADLDGPAEIMRKSECVENNSEDSNKYAGCNESNTSRSYYKTPFGIVFKPGDSDSLAAALKEIIENLDSYDRRAISDYARNTFSMACLVEQHLSLYERLLHGN